MALPARLEGSHVDDDSAAGIGRLAEADDEHVARDPEIFNRSGQGAEIAREGALLDPDAALAQPLPPPGDYRCRTIKIGSQSESGLEYVAYPAYRCRIAADDGLLTFTKLSGSQRPVGVLLPDSDRRYVFLGTLQLGDETGALQYGRDRERDMAAWLERVGERRWRLVFPSPHFESLLDVIELTPGAS